MRASGAPETFVGTREPQPLLHPRYATCAPVSNPSKTHRVASHRQDQPEALLGPAAQSNRHTSTQQISRTSKTNPPTKPTAATALIQRAAPATGGRTTRRTAAVVHHGGGGATAQASHQSSQRDRRRTPRQPAGPFPAATVGADVIAAPPDIQGSSQGGPRAAATRIPRSATDTLEHFPI